eukprot:GFKZ01004824.1.p1 GENE.GFKZ01004824.1~~GFKZ01004824.1.p1  ORF type:complete len:528 (+),score=54.82 GFKZ01004824.1:89-1585(+)
MLAYLLHTLPVSPLRRSVLPYCTPPLRSHTCSPALPSHRNRATASTAAALPNTARPATSNKDALLNAGLAIIVLKRGKANLFRSVRNTLVYAASVERHIHPIQRPLRDGDPVAVCSGSFSCLAFGFYNSQSMFRVRILRHVETADEETVERVLPWQFERDIEKRMSDAVGLRRELGLPSDATDVYRVVNGEGDRLSGLVVDRVGPTLVVASSALWCERYRQHIVQGLGKVLSECGEVIWRRNIERLKQDGWQEEDAPGKEAAEQDIMPQEEERAVVVRECGVQYALSRFAIKRGQKTGHYADQRENRQFVRELIQERPGGSRVLDLFCYTGGFAINAALGRPGTTVSAVDSSERALAMGRESAALNGVSHQIEFVHADVMKYLRSEEAADGELFDLVIVDPPKYAPNVKSLARAVHKYRSLNTAALGRVKAGGVLCTCSCSAAMTQERGLFIETVRQAGRQVGRELTLIKTFGAAWDHPIIPEMLEADYLTMCVFVCR